MVTGDQNMEKQRINKENQDNKNVRDDDTADIFLYTAIGLLNIAKTRREKLLEQKWAGYGNRRGF